MEKVAAVERSIWMQASIEKVWRAVTDPDQLDLWYANCCRWEIPALQVGGKVRFFNTETDIQTGTILVIDPPRQFSLRWEPGEEYPMLSLVTTFTLAAEDGGTRATITETGYEVLPPDVGSEWADAASAGYAGSVANLKALVEGRELPYPRAE